MIGSAKELGVISFDGRWDKKPIIKDPTDQQWRGTTTQEAKGANCSLADIKESFLLSLLDTSSTLPTRLWRPIFNSKKENGSIREWNWNSWTWSVANFTTGTSPRCCFYSNPTRSAGPCSSPNDSGKTIKKRFKTLKKKELRSRASVIEHCVFRIKWIPNMRPYLKWRAFQHSCYASSLPFKVALFAQPVTYGVRISHHVLPGWRLTLGSSYRVLKLAP